MLIWEVDMNQLWEATFQVDGDCQWRFRARTKQEALEIAEAKFRGHPEWSRRYPTTPPCSVQQVPRPAARVEHDDSGKRED